MLVYYIRMYNYNIEFDVQSMRCSYSVRDWILKLPFPKWDVAK